MAIVFFDSFDDRTTLLDNNWIFAAGGSMAISAGNGRFGGACLRINSNSNKIRHALPGSYGTLIFSFSWRASATHASILMQLLDNTSEQLTIRRRDDQKIQVLRGDSSGTSLAISSLTVTDNSIWHHVDIKVTIDNSGGAVLVKVDGVTFINITSQDTQQTANAYATGFLFGEDSNNAYNIDYCDFVVMDTSGSAPLNDIIGDLRLITDFPVSAGTDTAWTPSAGANYQCVDEMPPNDDTDYVEGSNVGDKDNYTFPNLPANTGTVYAVGVVHRAKKTDAIARSIAAQTLLSGTYGTGPDLPLSTDYQTFQTVFPLDPASAAWTVSNVNAAKIGQKVSV